MKRTKINKKACASCGLEAAVARKICSGCNTPFHSKKPTYFYECKESKHAAGTNSDGGAQLAHLPSASANDQSTASFSTGTAGEEGCRRRTERVKREKPHFYDASEFQNPNKKKKNEKNKSSVKPHKTTATSTKKKERKRLKKLRESLVEMEEENFYENTLTPRKSEQLAIILEELNNKLAISSWKP